MIIEEINFIMEKIKNKGNRCILKTNNNCYTIVAENGNNRITKINYKILGNRITGSITSENISYDSYVLNN